MTPLKSHALSAAQSARAVAHRRLATPWKLAIALVVTFSVVSATEADGEDWPHWRGPRRNDHIAENSRWEGGAWPIGEPVWRKNVGRGSTSPLVVDGKVYTLGSRDDQEHVYCLDAADGKQLWTTSYRCPLYGRKSNGDKGLYAGVTSTPEFDLPTGHLYTLSIDGDLNCWDTRKEGRRVWGFNLYERYDIPQRPKVNRSSQRDYGYTSSPLVQGPQLIVEVGAREGNLIAFDKLTGRQAWTSAAKDPAGHNGGPVPMTVENVPCIAVHHHNGLLVIRADGGHEGRTVATYPWRTEYANNIATAAVHENFVLLTSAYNHYKIAKLRISLSGATKIWEQDFASKVCTPVIHDGHVYWSWQQLHCLDFKTGKLLWQGGRLGTPGSCIVTSDDRLIVWAQNGDLVLAETAQRSPARYRELAARRGLFRTDVWPHIAMADGKLICKDREGNLICFDLDAR